MWKLYISLLVIFSQNSLVILVHEMFTYFYQMCSSKCKIILAWQSYSPWCSMTCHSTFNLYIFLKMFVFTLSLIHLLYFLYIVFAVFSFYKHWYEKWNIFWFNIISLYYLLWFWKIWYLNIYKFWCKFIELNLVYTDFMLIIYKINYL